MVPPKHIKYFFTFGDHHIRIAKDQPICNNNKTVADLDMHDDILINIPKLNYMDLPTTSKSLITEEFLNKMTVKPRPDPKYPPVRIRPKTPWDFNKSIFAPYKSDNSDILNQWFEIDWENSKTSKLVKEEESEIKEYLRSIYRNIREWYKFYAGILPSNQVFWISKTLFNEIINSINPPIVDSNLSLAAIDLEFITTMSGNRGGKLNPTRDLIRYQFLEIFVRLAIHKYYKTKICKSKLESIQRFFGSDLKEFLNKFNSYEWREQKYFCEEVEFILKEYKEELDELFRCYSGRYTMPSKPKFVSLEEFTEMVSNSGILKLNITNKDIGKYFNLSIETQPDELGNERHMQMFILEFYESIARIAEKIEFDSK